MPVSRALCSSRRITSTCIKYKPRKPPVAPLPPIRHFHHAGEQRATPIPHPTVTGPPPQPPQGAVDQADAVAARKRKNAALLQKGLDLKSAAAATGSPSTTSSTTSASTSPLKRRFWKDVSVHTGTDGSYRILLDSRPVRTPSKDSLALPASKRALATAIALEWDTLVSAQQALRSHHIPLTSSAARALDISAADDARDPKPRNEVVHMLLRYFSTDTLLCWAPDDATAAPTSSSSFNASGTQAAPDGNSSPSSDSLRARQIATARPILAFLAQHVFPGARITPTLEAGGIMPSPQEDATVAIVEAWLRGLGPWELAALERGTLATKSFLVAVRLVAEWSEELRRAREQRGAVAQGEEGRRKGRFGIVEASEAATVEVRWQTGMWGEVEDTHDVEREDLARQLGTVVLLVS